MPIVSEAKLDQAEAIFHLLKEIYGSSDQFCESLGVSISNAEKMYDEIDHYKKSPSSAFFVLTVEGELAGFLQLQGREATKLRHTCDLTMGIHPKFRKCGLGKALLKSSLERRPSEIEIIYLMVRGDNEAAIHLYQSFDFNKIAVLERDTKIGSDYFDGVLMRKFVKGAGSSHTLS
jgi:ribosomal protein S18 acetylase RimI-like enzyme